MNDREDAGASPNCFLNVQIGEVEASAQDVFLVSQGIGSCIVIVAFDAVQKIGAMAHIMLPGCAPGLEAPGKTRYAFNSIDELLRRMENLGSHTWNVEVCLIGGGNVLNKPDDTICSDNQESVCLALSNRKIHVAAASLGGFSRRSAKLDIRNGLVYVSEGDERERLLHAFARRKKD